MSRLILQGGEGLLPLCMSTMLAQLGDLACCSKANVLCGAQMCAQIKHMQQPMSHHHMRHGCITYGQACCVLT